METPGEQKESTNGQLISFNRKDTCRLLEVYVKRSLSLNDGNDDPPKRSSQHRSKWEKILLRVRRHSSDTSLHSVADPDDYGPAPPSPPYLASPAFSSEAEEDEEEEVIPEWAVFKSGGGLVPLMNKGTGQEEQVEITDNCLPLSRGHTRSFKRSSRIDITAVEPLVNVEPTYSYFEKVSQEMELIVQQVQEPEQKKVMPNEETINRLIAVTIEQGNAIDEKLKDNPTLSNFFNNLSYAAFQKLADNYLEAETTPVQNQARSLHPAPAPELVKLAFTLDFTARMARLLRQKVGHIISLGKRYLEDRFEYKQACTDHPWSDTDE